MLKKILAIVLFLMLASFASASDVFLRLEGVVGLSTDAAHKNWSDVTGFEVLNSGSSAVSIVVTRKMDSVTPDIVNLCAIAKRMKDITVEIMNSGVLLDRVKMTNATITSIKHKYSRADNPEPIEEITFSAASVMYENK